MKVEAITFESLNLVYHFSHITCETTFQ